MLRIERSLAVLVVVLSLGLVASVAGTSFAESSASVAAKKTPAIATLAVERPNVTVKKKGSDTFVPATDGQTLRQGDTIQTDATGRATVNYTDDAYTRLDVNTTFTIEKLTEDQGARQIEGSLDTGRTWNRTEALTESGSFEQSGAGATAATTGTAFVVSCLDIPSPLPGVQPTSECTFLGVYHQLVLRSRNGEVRDVPAFGECTSVNADLCDEVHTLTPDEMAAITWVQQNLLRDLTEFNFGPGPIQVSGVLVVEHGQVVSFTPASTFPTGTTPTTTTSSNTSSNNANNPSNPPPPPTAVIDPTNPILVDDGTGSLTTAELLACPEPMVQCVPASSITVAPGDTVLFAVNVASGTDPTGLFVVFDAVPASNVGRTCDNPSQECNDVAVGTQYEITQVFSFTGSPSAGGETAEIKFHIENAEGVTIDTSPTIDVHVTCSECAAAATSSAAQQVSTTGSESSEMPVSTEPSASTEPPRSEAAPRSTEPAYQPPSDEPSSENDAPNEEPAPAG